MKVVDCVLHCRLIEHENASSPARAEGMLMVAPTVAELDVAVGGSKA